MALSLTVKTRVRMYLGYERGYDLNYELESKFDALSAEEETEVTQIVTDLEAVRTRMRTVTSNGTLEASNVGKVQLRTGGDPLEPHRMQGRTLVSALESMFGVEAARDFFGPPAGSLGGPIPLG